MPSFFFFHFQKGMLVFDTAQFDGILKKVVEFNNALLSDQVGYMIEDIFSFSFLLLLCNTYC